MKSTRTLDVILDMETGDPDDAMTLCLLTAHPLIRLRAVTITPGTNEQIGLARFILRETGLDIPVGSYKPGHDKKCVGRFYRNWLGNFSDSDPDDQGWKMIRNTLSAFPEAQLLTGAPLRNLAGLDETLRISRWVAQGGFAGDNIVPEEIRLEKFKGRITCPTYNFNGDPVTAEKMLRHPGIRERYLVSKNVCHGVVYDQEMHRQLLPQKQVHRGLELLLEGMELYLDKSPGGKKWHDPLAACVLIDPEVCEFRQVKMYRTRGEWGCVPSEDSNTFISVRCDREKMMEVMMCR